MTQEERIFLHYTRAELDRNYDQRGWCPNALEFIEGYARESQKARQALSYKTFNYGSAEDTTLDVFSAAKRDAPTLIFIHGGAWRNFSKDDYSFVAPRFVEAGVHCIVLNFSKLPERRLPDICAQLRDALKWIYDHPADHGGNREKLYLCGHSSGAHLAALMISSDWRKFGLPPDILKGCTLISGSYDLEPAVLSSRGSYISVSRPEIRQLSPLYSVYDIACPVCIAYAERDTDEFRRQSKVFSEALSGCGKLTELLFLKEIGHFAIVEQLSHRDSPLFSMILSHIQKTTFAPKQWPMWEYLWP